jgi:hypothetical protein
MPVTVPAVGDFGTRVTRTAQITRERKSRARGASAALFVPAFLLLARTGLLRWFASHQRLVHTFVTNLRGPEDPLTFGGAAVRAIIPIPVHHRERHRDVRGVVLRRNAAHHHPVRRRPHARRPGPSRRPPPRTVRGLTGACSGPVGPQSADGRDHELGWLRAEGQRTLARSRGETPRASTKGSNGRKDQHRDL